MEIVIYDLDSKECTDLLSAYLAHTLELKNKILENDEYTSTGVEMIIRHFGITCTPQSGYSVDKKHRIVEQLKTLDYVLGEMEDHISNKEPEQLEECCNTWIVLHISGMDRNAESILGGVFVYDGPHFILNDHMEIEFIKDQYPVQIDIIGMRYIYMQGIFSSIDLMLAKLGCPNLPKINDYIPQAVINYAIQHNIDMIFVSPIGIQAKALYTRGFHYMKVITSDYCVMPDVHLIATYEDDGVFLEVGEGTMIYLLN